MQAGRTFFKSGKKGTNVWACLCLCVCMCICCFLGWWWWCGKRILRWVSVQHRGRVRCGVQVEYISPYLAWECALLAQCQTGVVGQNRLVLEVFTAQFSLNWFLSLADVYFLYVRLENVFVQGDEIQKHKLCKHHFRLYYSLFIFFIFSEWLFLC